MTDYETLERNAKAGSVAIKGSLNEIEYGAVVNVKDKLLYWFHEPAVPQSQGSATEVVEKSSDCIGCGKKGIKSFIERAARGGWGLIKSEMGWDPVSEYVRLIRKQTCLACPSKCYDFGVCRKELGGCGCFLDAKIEIASESCPHRHWLAITVEGKTQ